MFKFTICWKACIFIIRYTRNQQEIFKNSPETIRDIIYWKHFNNKDIVTSLYTNSVKIMTLIELIWTITPALILMLIAFPAEWFRKLFKRVKLSNFGKALKLLIPSHYRKIVSGWSNYSCKVKSQKMIEREMGNRETKSVGFMVFKSITVKEQRVYGSWYIVPLYLRCTLMGFERN